MGARDVDKVRMYSDLALKWMAEARFMGPLEGATQVGVAGTPGEGPYLEVVEGTIIQAAFKTFGCQAATACGSVTAGLVTGRTLEQAGRLTAADLLKIVGGVPEGKEYCAELAIEALRRALEGKREGNG
jgi:nitrogen fixation NifU-like protein